METWKKPLEPRIEQVVSNEQMVCLFLIDGTAISISANLFPVPFESGHSAIRNCQVSDDGQSVYWPDCDFTLPLSRFLQD